MQGSVWSQYENSQHLYSGAPPEEEEYNTQPHDQLEIRKFRKPSCDSDRSRSRPKGDVNTRRRPVRSSKNKKKEKIQSHKRKRRRKSTPDGDSYYHDEDGHFIVRTGRDLTRRYKVLDQIGEGTFGKVVECWDRRKLERVAVKVVRAVPKYTDSAQIEIDIIDDIQRMLRRQGIKEHSMLKVRDTFMYHSHRCIVTPLYGLSLYDFIKRERYCGFPLESVCAYSFQMFAALSLFKTNKLIHTDLKPENILFRDGYDKDSSGHRIPRSNRIVIIDYGSALYEYHHHTTVISTRHYRAPEVILGASYSIAADMWSAGCILVELLTGEALFQTHDNLEHLAMMQRMLGDVPDRLLNRATRRHKYFHRNKLLWPVNASSRQSVEAVEDCPTSLKAFIQNNSATMKHGNPLLDLFIDLCYKCLQYDDKHRITPHEALQHPFFDSLAEDRELQAMVPNK